MPNPLRKINKMVRREQSQGGRIGGGSDEPPSASMRKGKPGRTAPSSRVKKIVKEGNKKFVGPRQDKELDENYNPYNEEMETYIPRGKEARKSARRRDKIESTLYRGETVPGAYDRKKVNLNHQEVYRKLRENLSPANARLLDILAGRGGTDFEDGQRRHGPEDDIPF